MTTTKKKAASPRKKATTRRLRTTAATKPVKGTPVPTASELAAFAGVKVTAPLKPKASQQLLKPVPGYRAVMDNVANNLTEDNDVLKLKYEPEEILGHLANAKDLSARANVLQTVWAGVDAARQIEDGYLMKVLLDVVKRVREQSGAHPELLVTWAEVLEFVKKYRPGPAGSTATATPVGDPTAVNETSRRKA